MRRLPRWYWTSRRNHLVKIRILSTLALDGPATYLQTWERVTTHGRVGVECIVFCLWELDTAGEIGHYFANEPHDGDRCHYQITKRGRAHLDGVIASIMGSSHHH